MASLPDWLDPLPDAAQQRALDEWAIGERGIPGLELMERAGTGLADLVGELAPAGRIVGRLRQGQQRRRRARRGARCCASGAARSTCCCSATPSELRGDARANLERLPGAPPEPFDGGGAGRRGARSSTRSSGPASRASRASPRPARSRRSTTPPRAPARCVVACDVPSGVDASTGEVAGVAVRARATATFHAAKPGLWIAPGKTHAGEVRVVDIGIPAGGPGEPQVGLISDRASDGIPRRGRDSNKFAAGSVLVCGGSLGLTGAPCLASESAMRAGAGYVTACVPASLNLIFESAAARGDDRAAARYGRGARARRRRGRCSSGPSAPTRWCSGRGSGARRRRRSSPGSWRRYAPRAAAARRRRAERARRRARLAGRARRRRPC